MTETVTVPREAPLHPVADLEFLRGIVADVDPKGSRNPFSRTSLALTAIEMALEAGATTRADLARERERADRLTDENEALRQEPWPEWATKVLAAIRKRSGYDGYDDQDNGVDLAAELEEAFSELEREAESARADRDALAAALADARERAAGSMDVLAAMRETVALARSVPSDAGRSSLWPSHLRDMLTRMEAGAFSYGKQCRWLGWAQAAVVANGDATLDDMKAINKRCQRSRQEPAR